MMSRPLAAAWVGAAGVPSHPQWGALYPMRAVLVHAQTSAHRRAVDAARRIIDARGDAAAWRVGASCGKDSTALALLLAEAGAPMTAMSVKDDLDYPGEDQYAVMLAERCGVAVEIVRPPVSLQAFLRDNQISLIHDVHSRTAELSKTHFYALLDQHRAAKGYDAVMLGLRMAESRGRRMNTITNGTNYTRAYDSLTVCTPLARWTAMDVHAFLASREVPLLPVYGCIDPGMEWDGIRKSWWIAGGGPARMGSHYAWLRRWWPALWDRAASIDPSVRDLS